MASNINSWIHQTILLQDKRYGSDFTLPWTGKRYCQLIRFDTFRTASNPHATVSGVISDKSHTVRVTFEAAATDSFERKAATGNTPSKTLTSHLRSIFALRAFRISLIPPDHFATCVPGVPRVCLHVLDWEVICGDRKDPVFWRDTFDIGTGPSDGNIRRTLRKWWSGDSDSSPAPPSQSVDMANAAAGPSRQNGANSRITIGELLDPYINPAGGTKQKQIPEWIFNVPEATRKELDGIKYFNLAADEAEVAAESKPQPQGRSQGDVQSLTGVFPSGPIATDTSEGGQTQNGSLLGREDTSFSGSIPRPDRSFPQPGQRVPSLSTGPLASTLPEPLTSLGFSANAVDEDTQGDDLEDDFIFRPLASQGVKKNIVDPLAFPSSPHVSSSPVLEPSADNSLFVNSKRFEDDERRAKEEEDDDDDDEDAHSAYSNSKRTRRHIITQESMEDMEMVEQQSSPVREEGDSQPHRRAQSSSQSQSFSASQRSTEEFSLSRYSKSQPPDGTRVLVQESDEITYGLDVVSSGFHNMRDTSGSKTPAAPMQAEVSPYRDSRKHTPPKSSTPIASLISPSAPNNIKAAGRGSFRAAESASVGVKVETVVNRVSVLSAQQVEMRGRSASPHRSRAISTTAIQRDNVTMNIDPSNSPADFAHNGSEAHVWPDNFPPPPSPDLLPARHRRQFTPILRRVKDRSRAFTPQIVAPDSPLSIGSRGAFKGPGGSLARSHDRNSPAPLDNVRQSTRVEQVDDDAAAKSSARERFPSASVVPKQEDGDSDLDALEGPEYQNPPVKKRRITHRPKLNGFRLDLHVVDGIDEKMVSRAEEMLKKRK